MGEVAPKNENPALHIKIILMEQENSQLDYHLSTLFDGHKR